MDHPIFDLMSVLTAQLPQDGQNMPALAFSEGEFVEAVYRDVLGRSADAEALAFWTRALNQVDAAHLDGARAALIHTLVYSEFSRTEDGLWSQKGEPDVQSDLLASLAAIESGIDFSLESTQISRDGVLMISAEPSAALALIGQVEAGFTLI